MTLNRYWAAFFTLALTIVGAIVVIPAGAFDWKAAIQLGILGVTTGTTVGLPLLAEGSKWRGALKVGAAIVLAVLSALTPLIVGGVYDHVTIGLIVLSVLQVIAGQVGVVIRADAKKQTIDGGTAGAGVVNNITSLGQTVPASVANPDLALPDVDSGDHAAGTVDPAFIAANTPAAVGDAS